jgi:hypothetical protein
MQPTIGIGVRHFCHVQGDWLVRALL